jgi:hypothetical protein
MIDPSNQHRDIYDLGTDPPLRMDWRATDGPTAVINGKGRYCFCDVWDKMSPEERLEYPRQFNPPPVRPHNPGTRVFDPRDRMGRSGSAFGKQGLSKWIWDLAPDDGGEPMKVLMDLSAACESVERGRGRYCFCEGGDATPPRADVEINR